MRRLSSGVVISVAMILVFSLLVVSWTVLAQEVTSEPEATAEAMGEAPPMVTAGNANSPATNADWTPQVEEHYGINFVYVPAGTFTMGTSEADADMLFADCESAIGAGNCPYEWFGREVPQSDVTLPAFWISETEITNAQYRMCVDAGACTPPSDTRYYDDAAFDNAPVVYVTWDQAREFALWLSPNGDVHLPNEAQWEYAARGVDALVYPWGDDFDPNRVNYCDSTCLWESRDFDTDDGNPELGQVGMYPEGASWVGALDMAGNVREFTTTMYHEQAFLYPYDPSDGRNEIETDRNEARVVRGGSWQTVSRDVRTATRGVSPFPMAGEADLGFRVVIEEPVTEG